MAAKRRKKSKVGIILYWIFLVAFTVALAFAASSVIKDVNRYLLLYENSQPDSTINSFMIDLKDNIFRSQVSELAASKPHPFQTNEECEQIILNELGDNLTYQRSGSASSSGTRYGLYSAVNPETGYYQIGSVTLRQDTSQADNIDIGILGKMFNRESLCPWFVSESEYDISAFGSMTSLEVVCPESYSVAVNGNTVGNEYIAETGIHYPEFEKYYAEHPNLPTKVRYSVNGLIFGSVEPVIYDNNGNVYEIPASKYEECHYWDGNVLNITIDDMVRLPISDEELTELRSFADGFISPYLNYFGTKNVNTNAGALRNLIIPGCDIDNRMTEFLDGAMWIHYYSLQLNSYSFDDAFSLGDGFYAIDVSYDATAFGEYKNVQEASTLRIVVCRTDMGLRAISAE